MNALPDIAPRSFTARGRPWTYLRAAIAAPGVRQNLIILSVFWVVCRMLGKRAAYANSMQASERRRQDPGRGERVRAVLLAPAPTPVSLSGPAGLCFDFTPTGMAAAVEEAARAAFDGGGLRWTGAAGHGSVAEHLCEDLDLLGRHAPG